MKAFLYESEILKLKRKNAKLVLSETAAEVAEKIEAISIKSGIPTISYTNCANVFSISKIFITFKKYQIMKKGSKLSKYN